MNNASVEKIFQISAVISIGFAAYFLWSGSHDRLFMAGVVGAVCFFLSVRFQVKERMERRTSEQSEQSEQSEIEETNSEESETASRPELYSRGDDFSAPETAIDQLTENRRPTDRNQRL